MLVKLCGTEVEQAALEWQEKLDYAVLRGPSIAYGKIAK